MSTVMKKALIGSLLLALPLFAVAAGDDDELQGGLVTSMLNSAIERGMTGNKSSDSSESKGSEKMEYGRDITRYVSPPVFGGYFVGSYKYSSAPGAHNGDGFSVRMLRVYVNGSVLRDFYYRVQMELNGSTHLKDVFIEWRGLKEFRVKFGQYKRPFTFENPYTLCDVGMGDYAQVIKKLAGYSDYVYSEANGSNGGRDMGLEFSGDLFKLAGGRYRLVHYEAGIFNGQGINVSDSNGKKDWMGNIQLQPVEGLYLGLFGWKGTITENGVTAGRNRWAVGVKFDRKDWTARAEYVHHVGHKISDYVAANGEEPAHWTGNARADGWYATVGVPCTKWLKCYVKYDAYRADATNNTLSNMYSLCPNFELNKYLKFEVQYNYVHDKTATHRDHHELWVDSYILF